MKEAALICALGLIALAGTAPGVSFAGPHEHGGDGQGGGRPHGQYGGPHGPYGGPPPGARPGEHGRGGPGPYGGPPGPYNQPGMPYGHGPYGAPPRGPYGGPPRGPYMPPGDGRGYDGAGGPAYRAPHRQVPLEGVVGQMRRRFPGGRMLDADVEQRGGRTVYHVRWATGDGRRIDYIVDAETGAILGQED